MAVVHAHHDLADFFGRGEEDARLHQDLMVHGLQVTGIALPVGLLQTGDKIGNGQVSGCQPQGVEQHAHLAPVAADYLGFGNIMDTLDGIINLGRQPPQHVMIVFLAVKGQGQDRHIIDGVRLDQREGDSVRNFVKVALQFLVEPDNGILQVLPDIEAGHQKTLAPHGGGVDVFNPR